MVDDKRLDDLADNDDICISSENRAVARELRDARAENARLREALRFYANEANWDHGPKLPGRCAEDEGAIARAALEGK